MASPVNTANRVQSARLPEDSQLAIVGAGPIGLEAAAWATSRGWDVALFEQGEVAHHLRQWGHVRLFTPFGMNHSDWGPRLITRAFPELALPAQKAYLTGREYLEQYLVPLSQLPAVGRRLFLGAEVSHIGREGISKEQWIGNPDRGKVPFRLLIRRGDHEMIHRAQAVLDCSGVYSKPRFLGNGNIPVPGELQAIQSSGDLLTHGLVDLLGPAGNGFRDKRVLLIGGGYSAATALEGFQQLVREASSTRVYWVNRTPRPEPYTLFPEDPLPYRDELGRLANALARHPPSWLQYLGGSQVEEISDRAQHVRGGRRVLLTTPRGPKELEIDRILAHTGFMPDTSIYRQLQVHQCYATAGPIKLAAQLLGGSGDCLEQTVTGLEALTNPEPNFFILGNKSYGTNNTFLLRQGISHLELVLEHLEEALRAPGAAARRKV